MNVEYLQSDYFQVYFISALSKTALHCDLLGVFIDFLLSSLAYNNFFCKLCFNMTACMCAWFILSEHLSECMIDIVSRKG